MKNIQLIVVITLFLLINCSQYDEKNWQTDTEQAIENKDYSRAIKIMKNALENDPENAEKNYYLGQAYRLKLFDDGGTINDIDVDRADQVAYHFRKVISLDSSYNGTVFTIGPYTKIQGIWGAVAMTHLYHNEPEKAQAAFLRGKEEGGFYPAILELNRDIMATCEKDAILFTNGDNDTYPMWYLQMIEDFRPDITVVNLPLLNVTWYAKQIRNNYHFGHNNITLPFKDMELEELAIKPWYGQKERIAVFDDPLNKKGAIDWIMTPTIGDSHLRKQDQLLISIIKTNMWQRPVYFALTVSEKNKIGLNPYLSMHGLAYKLESHADTLNPEIMENNLGCVYQYNGVEDRHLQYIRELLPLYFNYRACFARLAEYYSNKGDQTRAAELIEMMNDKIPERKVPYANPEHKKEIDKLTRDILDHNIVAVK